MVRKMLVWEKGLLNFVLTLLILRKRAVCRAFYGHMKGSRLCPSSVGVVSRAVRSKWAWQCGCSYAAAAEGLETDQCTDFERFVNDLLEVTDAATDEGADVVVDPSGSVGLSRDVDGERALNVESLPWLEYVLRVTGGSREKVRWRRESSDLGLAWPGLLACLLTQLKARSRCCFHLLGSHHSDTFGRLQASFSVPILCVPNPHLGRSPCAASRSALHVTQQQAHGLRLRFAWLGPRIPPSQPASQPLSLPSQSQNFNFPQIQKTASRIQTLVLPTERVTCKKVPRFFKI